MAPITTDNCDSGCEFVDNSSNSSINHDSNSSSNNSNNDNTINIDSSSDIADEQTEEFIDHCSRDVLNEVAANNDNNDDDNNFKIIASEKENLHHLDANEEELGEEKASLGDKYEDESVEGFANQKQQQQEQDEESTVYKQMPWEAPGAQGLYDPQNEHEACGVGFIVSIDGRQSHKILRDAQTLSERMNHRGACACDNDTGDGAGVLASIPHGLYVKAMEDQGVTLPPAGDYATGILYLDDKTHDAVEGEFNALAQSLNLDVLAWRTVPANQNAIGAVARKSEPLSRQVFIGRPQTIDDKTFARQIFVLRKRASHELRKEGRRFYICSLSTKTIVYKGLFTSDQLWDYYTDLKDPLFETYLALVHTRFSTNTFPSWERAHPLRVLAHNGEINTLRGNVNLMKAREGVMQSEIFGEQLKKLYPVVEPNLSDSGSFDCVLEFLTMAGERTLPEAVMTMIPEAWQNDKTMSQEKRDFYNWAACVMEPWDGPALISFTDGRYIGAVLDRNGLRPSRFYVTRDNILVMASEVGVYDIDPSQVTLKSRLKPGRMLLVDTHMKKFIQDIELKSHIAQSRPHSDWLQQKITLDEIRNANAFNSSEASNGLVFSHHNPSTMGIFDPRLSLFGYSTETVNMLLVPMFQNKKEALGSMGNDAPLACLSAFQPIPYEYFKQLFAQVTNPPIDPFREKVVMSMQCPIGPEGNLLKPSAEQVHRLWLPNPILSIPDTNLLKRNTHRGWKTKVLDLTFPFADGVQGYIDCIDRVCYEGVAAANSGYQLLIISDRNAGPGRAPVSALLALGALHHHLIETLQRMKVGLIVETAEAREVHHICVLLGYGADAICPYLAFELAQTLRNDGVISPDVSDKQIYAAYAQAIDTGIAKVMAKMGISTLQSYKCAQIFEAVGLGTALVEKCFRGTHSRIGGVTLEILAREGLERYNMTYCKVSPDTHILRNPGQYHWRHGGEAHINEPASIASLQEATAHKNAASFDAFVASTMESVRKCALRGQLEFVTDRQKIDISEVEPASEIVKRFATGAMSFGSISLEAHQTLAITMNRIGGKSNTGEGGEDSDRYLNQEAENNRRSAIKQVASGRFGVTASYLANADDLQIKMAQGAKPGEGGELPGKKVTKDIAKTRFSVPGVGLISPPPHHDIYSIEDLAELIYDLKCANPNARISVKLVSEVGVGVVASGVAKGKAEHIVISGHDGGTGASSWTGIKNAGLPWELGIAETHQVLVLNNLRSRIVLQADGQLRTGFDIVVAALLGADEFGLSTAPLIVMGCTMMRKCHLNTCPVGIATQDPVLRKKFTGKPEHVVNFFFMLAEDIRKIMANLGVRKFQDLIGRTDFLRVAKKGNNPKANTLDLSLLLKNALELRPGTNIVGGSVRQDFQLEQRADNKLIALAQQIFNGTKDNVTVKMNIRNEERAFGSTLSYHIARKYGEAGLPAGKSIDIFLEGSAGQSFCAFLSSGVNVTLKGDANDYVGKGLCGGTVVILPPENVTFESHLNVIVGNVCLYGATSGRAYFRGIAAERFCVRNSGVTAVVEGVGDHGCEYMTGGVAVILGLTGRNFAAGMSGGIAYVYDIDGSFRPKVNHESVDLLPLQHEKDVTLVKELLHDFVEKTNSKIAQKILDAWQVSQGKFVKVFPYEYQKALQEIEEERVSQLNVKAIENGKNGTAEPLIKDIEETILDVAIEQKKAERILDKTRGFIKYKRETGIYRDAHDRQHDWEEVYNFPHVRKNLKVQAARCMECGVPFCQSNSHGCPLGNIIPKWNDLIFNGDWEEALRQLLQTNNFPEFTGRVCPAPCEGACVLGISEPAVTIKNIECAIIDHGFEQGWIKPEIPENRTGKRVAIVGSGPAGLAAAQQLNRAGHFVTVFERNDRVGGLLQYGIPTMKLSKAVVKRRVDLMADEGVEFRTNAHVGKDIKAEFLLNEYDALLITTGSTWPRDLPLDNRDLKGIHFAMEFLEAQQKKQLGGKNEIISAKDKNVIIIGGGDTGCDCIATSLRQGAKSITTFEILPQPPNARAEDNPWPQWPKVFRVDYGHEEVRVKFGKDPRQYCTTTKEFIGENGHITAVKTIEVEWTKGANGQWSMKEVPGSEKHFAADLILLAMGFLGPEKTVPNELGLELDPRGNIKACNGQYGTSNPKVFAAGDCRRGQSLVVWAITEGRQAARQVDSYLIGRPSGLPGPGGVVDPTRQV